MTMSPFTLLRCTLPALPAVARLLTSAPIVRPVMTTVSKISTSVSPTSRLARMTRSGLVDDMGVALSNSARPNRGESVRAGRGSTQVQTNVGAAPATPGVIVSVQFVPDLAWLPMAMTGAVPTVDSLSLTSTGSVRAGAEPVVMTSMVAGYEPVVV
jgi:hypothetical protein